MTVIDALDRPMVMRRSAVALACALALVALPSPASAQIDDTSWGVRPTGSRQRIGSRDPPGARVRPLTPVQRGRAVVLFNAPEAVRVPHLPRWEHLVTASTGATRRIVGAVSAVGSRHGRAQVVG